MQEKQQVQNSVPPLRPDKRLKIALITLSVIGFVIIVFLSVIALEFDPEKLPEAPGKMWDFVTRAFPPDWDVLPKVLWETVVTIQIGLLATIVATIIALPLAFVSVIDLDRQVQLIKSEKNALAKLGKSLYFGLLLLLRYISRFFFNFVRSIDTLIFALIFLYGFGPYAFSGMLALGVHSVGMLGKLYLETLEGVDKGPVEALEAVGANRLATKRWAVLPQVLPMFVSYTIYRFEINIRVAVVLGLVGAGGIGKILMDYMNNFQFERVSVVVITILVLVLSLDYFTTWLRKRIA